MGACGGAFQDADGIAISVEKRPAQMRLFYSTVKRFDLPRAALYRTIFPQMTGCLPEAEGAQLRFDFAAELAWLEAA